MRKLFLLLIGLLYFCSCEKEDHLSNLQLCEDKYFYYSDSSKIILNHSLSEVWIEFKQSDVTGEEAKTILSNYSFINADNLSADSYYDRFKAVINESCDCAIYRNYLKELNQDSEIFSATPIFYTSTTDPMSYWILLSEVLTVNNSELISESEFINYAETLNLLLVELKYSTQHFKVKEVITGFEALEISNQIYESGKVKYSHPNFIAKFGFEN